MAVLAGLNDAPVYRLKHTKDEIPTKWQKVFLFLFFDDPNSPCFVISFPQSIEDDILFFAKVWEELQELMNDVGSFANYRKALSSSNPPCIPYMYVNLRSELFLFCFHFVLTRKIFSGIYLRDLTYFESNTNEKPNIQGAIKFKQTKQVFSVIKLIQTYQKQPYTEFERNEEVRSLLLGLPTLPSTELFRLSNEREPKGAKRPDIR
jgi:hypothetical protein